MKKTAKRKTSPETLPRWALNDLITPPIEKNIALILNACAKNVVAFEKKYKGKLAQLNGDQLARAFRDYEALSEKMGRVHTYVDLRRAEKLDDPKIGKLHQTVNEEITEISQKILFFRFELNKLSVVNVRQKLKSKALQRYAPVIDDIRRFKEYQLPEGIELILHERSVVGVNAWARLFDETIARLRFPFEGKNLTENELFEKMASTNPKVREKAAKVAGQVFAENIQQFSLIMNTVVKSKEIDDRQRGYATPVSRRNLANNVEDNVVEALTTAVRDHYDLAHRYYAWKARWMGKKKLPYWDRNAPLSRTDARKVSWKQAREIVLEAYGRFHPTLSQTAARFFDEKWIDAEPRPGKDSGAFSHPSVPSVHPYILMNWQGRTRDLMTLAHELGHGVHQVLAAKQGYFMASTPLTLAETASVFGEMLTFRAMLEAESDPQKRKLLLAGKVEDMLNTVVRQISFHDFETRVHQERKNGELTAERLGEIWMDVMRESLGPSIEFDENYRHFWCYIPHLIHTPFYVYSYAFGDCLVNALYAVYQESEQGFADKYIQMLESGGTKGHKELLAPFGLDASDPNFWKKGLSVIESFIDELENEFTPKKKQGSRKIAKARK